MCRIAGIIDFNKSLGYEIKPALISMRDVMTHGGPDDAGFYLNNDLGIALGHRRLSIIDLSSLGHQPMSNSDETIWITYNGEIYNFQELKDDLIKIGYHFKSRTDTEVLIYGYEEWGIEKLLFRLRGMFAFAILDLRNPSYKLFLAKDRFGIKPLYYYKDKEKFVFASEVRAILRSGLVPDEKSLEAMVRFLQLGSVPVPLTTVKNVFALPSGHYIEITPEKFNIKQYYNLAEVFSSKENENISFEEAAGQTRKLLEESVKLHLVSDVPVGVFLSGGIDSSSLVSIASQMQEKPLTTLSIVFDEKNYSESYYSNLVSKQFKTNHNELLITKSDFANELPKIFEAMDESSINGVNVYFVSKAAREVGLTVVLSGIGGDEVFLGYSHFQKARLLELFKKSPKLLQKTLISMFYKFKGFEKLSYLNNFSTEGAYLLFRGLFTSLQIQALLGLSENELKEETQLAFNGPLGHELVKSFDYFEFKHYLQNQILKDTDFMSMRHAIEVRVPFLDHKLFEYVFNLPASIKFHDKKVNKSLLVKALRNELPKKIWNRPKMGFTLPFNNWIKKEWEMFQEISLDQDIFDKKVIKEIWRNYLNGKVHWSRVWALVVAGRKMQFKELSKI